MNGWINVYLGRDGVQFHGIVVWPTREMAKRMSRDCDCSTIYRVRVRAR